MKKLMIVLAAVALAGATQAATMTWSALNMQAKISDQSIDRCKSYQQNVSKLNKPTHKKDTP